MAIMDNAALSVLKLRAEELFAAGQYRDQYIVYAETARAILNEQSAFASPITGRQAKDNEIEINWIDTCARTTEVCPADWCDINPTQLTTKKMTYDLTLCRTAGFSIDENDIAGSTYSREDVFAIGQLRHKALLDQWVSQQGLIFLKANEGANLYPSPYTYNATTKNTEIPPSKYNRKLVPYMERMAILHEINNPYYIDNGTLWEDWRNAQLDSADCCGKGDARRVDALRLYFDLQGFAQAGITPEDTFMVGKNAVFLGNRWYNPDAPTQMSFRNGTQTRWNELSNNLPGIHYDVIYQMACLGKRVVHSWTYIFNGGYFLNPLGCQPTVTGIMAFNDTAAEPAP